MDSSSWRGASTIPWDRFRGERNPDTEWICVYHYDKWHADRKRLIEKYGTENILTEEL